MFKKKTKKDQGVLLADEEHSRTLNITQRTQVEPSQPPQQPPNDIKSSNSPNNIASDSNKKIENEKNTAQKGSEGPSQSQNLKRQKNPELLYQRDSNQHLGNAPSRIQQSSFKPSKTKGGFSASTLANKEQKEKQVRDAFNDISHKAGTNLIKDLQLPQDQLEEEAAKRRYMQNVEQTRLAKEGKLNTKIYRGMNAYTNHKLTSNDIKNAEESYKKVMGPSRLNSTIKNTCRFDYVQNICKDWHDSGYCPFGNSCLYLHDRSNVKTGWQLQRDYQQQQRERWRRINNPEIAKKEDKQKLLKTIEKYRPPECCQSCQEKYKSPVEVQCGHIFCSSCAIKMMKCKVCNKRISGIMNNATEKLNKLSKNYQELVAKLENEQEDVLQKRRKFQNTSSLDVFAD